MRLIDCLIQFFCDSINNFLINCTTLHEARFVLQPPTPTSPVSPWLMTVVPRGNIQHVLRNSSTCNVHSCEPLHHCPVPHSPTLWICLSLSSPTIFSPPGNHAAYRVTSIPMTLSDREGHFSFWNLSISYISGNFARINYVLIHANWKACMACFFDCHVKLSLEVIMYNVKLQYLTNGAWYWRHYYRPDQ